MYMDIRALHFLTLTISDNVQYIMYPNIKQYNSNSDIPFMI